MAFDLNRPTFPDNTGNKRICKIWLPKGVAARLEYEGQLVGLGLSGVVRMLCVAHTRQKSQQVGLTGLEPKKKEVEE